MYAVAEISEFGFGRDATMKEHKDIYEAAVSRDVAGCRAAIETHVTVYQNKYRSGLPVLFKGQSRQGCSSQAGTKSRDVGL